jgi:hypothetical protein
MTSTIQESRYYVRQDPSGACYVIDRYTNTCVYGSFRAGDAQVRRDKLNAGDPATELGGERTE